MAEQLVASNSMSVLEDLEQMLDSVNQAVTEKSEIESFRTEIYLLNHSIEDIEISVKGNSYLEIWVSKIKEAAKIIQGILDEHVPKNSLFRDLSVYMGIQRKSANNVKVLLADIRRIEESSEFRDHMSGFDMSKVKNYGIRPYFDLFDTSIYVTKFSTVELIENYVLGGDKRLSAIAVLGASGVGKTTLARKIYHVQAVKERFDFRTWITVPYRREKNRFLNCTAKQMLMAGGHQIPVSKEELIEAVIEMLWKRRCLLVFDDVWSEEFLPILSDILVENNMGSRIIFTTRKESVVASCKDSWFSHVHRIEPLSEAKSLEVFRTRLFGDSPLPSEFVQFSHEVVRMCEGVPLAIEVVADFLSKKANKADHWKMLIESFGVAFQSDRNLGTLSRILELSFVDLPLHLKQCFLYLSIFPKESLIPNDKLFQLWIAEGFVREKIGKTLEEVSEEYLNELVGRNLVQACEGFYGIEKLSRVPRLLHEIAQQKADEISFCQIWDDRENRFGGKGPRLLVSNAHVKNILEASKESQVGSVFLSNVGAIENSVMVGLLKKYKTLISLDVENSPLELLPKEVENLSNLKYLSLKDTKVKKLPKSIGKLGKLQTLDVSGTLLVELPMEIFKLKNLRHLLATRCDNPTSFDSAKGVKVKEGIRSLVNLQTLMTVDANLSGMYVIKELRWLSELRSLSVLRLTTELSNALHACITNCSRLESLRLESMSNHVLDLQSVWLPPSQLKRLVLKGALRRFPEWISLLRNLVMLSLSLSSLSDSPLRDLSACPDLECLWLYRAFKGTQLHFNDGDFLRLKLLVLREMQGLESIVIEEGVMPLLEELRIGPSPLLSEVPAGIIHLKNLKVVSFYDMPNGFVLNMQPDGGSEYWKVKKVPSVLFWYRDNENCYISYNLGESDLLRRLEGLDMSVNDLNRHDLRMSFSYTDDDASTSSLRFDYQIAQSNVSSDRFTFFTDDVEQ